MPTKVPQICRIGSLRSWTSSAAFITCPSLQSSKICPTLLTHPLIDWHRHLLSCLGQLTRWLKHPPIKSKLSRSKVCPFLQMHVWVVKWKGNALSIPIRWHCQKKQASATIKYIQDFFLTLTRLQQFVLLPNIGHSHLVTLKLAQCLLPLASAIFAARGENFVYPSIWQ